MTSPDQFGPPERGSPQSQRKASLRNIPSAILRYCLAVVSVALAVLATLFLQHYKFRGVALFLFAIAVTAWYAGVAPAILATALSILCFMYFFSPPNYSFAFSLADVPTMVILLSFALLIIRFSAVRRRIESQLLRAREELQIEVVERTRQASLLRRSEAYLAEAQRLSKTGSWAWSPASGEPLYWSAEMFRIFGLDPREGVPTRETFFQRIHSEDLDQTYQLLKKATLQSMHYEHEHRIVLPDGTVKHIHAIGHPVLDETGRIVEFVGTAMDVTERKRAEETLRRSEAYLAEAQRLTHTGSWARNVATGETTHSSEEHSRLFGFDPELGLPSFEEFSQHIHPEDRAKVAEAFDNAIRERIDFEVDLRTVMRDHTIKCLHAVGHPVFNTAGDLIEYVGTVVDVSQEKRAEESLRRSEAYLVEAQRLSHTGSWAYSHATDRAIYWSDETFRIFGFDSQRSDPPHYDEFIRLIHPEDRDRFRENTLRCYREKVGFTQEYRLMLPDGAVKYIHEIGHPVLDGSGKLVEYLGTLIDVTERKRAEEEIERLRRLEADLARVNRVSMMGELAASLAHEIKQPIAAAATNANTGLLWLQREPPETGKAREVLSRILNDAKRAADIIERNRSLYRGDTPKRETVNLNEVVREIIALLWDTANRQSAPIRAELDGDAPTVTADRVQMQQVLMNLMLNGIEAMKDTGGELTVRSEKTEDHQIRLSVSDAGVGLPSENADSIFDAFFTTKAQGTGMGLSICRRIIESHGGRLWACANTGRGATFHFTLPTAASTSSTAV